MKNLTNCSVSPLGYIALTVLFFLPYVGTPALLICAIFVRNEGVRNYARAWIIAYIIFVLLVAALVIVLSVANPDLYTDLFGEYEIFPEEGLEAFNGIVGYAKNL